VVFFSFFRSFKKDTKNAFFSFVCTSFHILCVHLANTVDANALFNLFFLSDDDDDWSSYESDDLNKEKLQAHSQKMAELKQKQRKIMADSFKISALQFLVNSDSSTEELKKKAHAMLVALFYEVLSAIEEKERKRD
tara:strand:+ start:321 stop:728 length:408 start_codon:yes stop_codon:yes gene_type:complete